MVAPEAPLCDKHPEGGRCHWHQPAKPTPADVPVFTHISSIYVCCHCGRVAIDVIDKEKMCGDHVQEATHPAPPLTLKTGPKGP
jgi:hypothetical protein